MDIAKINEVRDLESAECEVVDGNGERLFSLTIAGPTHARTRQHTESEGRGLAHASKKLGGFQKAIDARTETFLTDSDIAVEKTVRTLMARTLDWKDVTDKGEPIPYDPKQMEAWYVQHAWLRDQVNAFIGDPRNFLSR